MKDKIVEIIKRDLTYYGIQFLGYSVQDSTDVTEENLPDLLATAILKALKEELPDIKSDEKCQSLRERTYVDGYNSYRTTLLKKWGINNG